MELLLIALLFILHNLFLVAIYAVALICVNLNICHNITVVEKKSSTAQWYSKLNVPAKWNIQIMRSLRKSEEKLIRTALKLYFRNNLSDKHFKVVLIFFFFFKTLIGMNHSDFFLLRLPFQQHFFPFPH